MPEQITQQVNRLKSQARREYDRAVNRDLSRQQSEGMLKRNMTAVLKQAYDQSIAEVKNLVAENHEHDVYAVLQCFDGFTEEMLDYVLQKHRSSCAISNFPEEHNPSPQYINEVLEQVENDWQGFVATLTTIG